MTPDLFADPLIAGLDYRPDFITAEEERALIGRLSTLDVSPFRFHGWLGNRQTRSFGWRYDFDDASFTPTEPVPDWLEPLRAKAAGFAGVAPAEFHHALVARYDPGAGIGWHKDRDVFDAVFHTSGDGSAGSGAPQVCRRCPHWRRRAAQWRLQHQCDPAPPEPGSEPRLWGQGHARCARRERSEGVPAPC